MVWQANEPGCYTVSEERLDRDFITQVQPLVERVSEWKGQLVEVVEQITRSPGTLDRHFTTRSSVVMRLESVAIAFSGATLMVMGKAHDRGVNYQVACDLIEHLSLESDNVVLVERFAGIAERHSTFNLISGD